MIDYLTHDSFIGYNEQLRPSQQSPGVTGGGVATKTARVMAALGTQYRVRTANSVEELKNPVVLVEPLLFSMRQHGTEPLDTEIELLKAHDAFKILYCSEKALLRLPHDLRHSLIGACDVVTYNCEFQYNLFRYVDIRAPLKLLCDPIPTDIFTFDESAKKRQIVASGYVDWFKNPWEVAAVFAGLEGAGVERVYVGSSGLWQAESSKVAAEAEQQIYDHTDTVIAEANRAELAAVWRDSRLGLWVPYHETFAFALNEMLMSGVIAVGANHGGGAELPITRVTGAEAKIEWVKRIIRAPEEELNSIASEIRESAKKRCSYDTFLDQFKTIIC